MSERLLAVLLQQALLLSVGVLVIGALRSLLLKRLGAGSVYAAWLLVPALLLTPLLPRPAQEPLRVVLQATGSAETVAMPVLPSPPLDQAAIWLALWLCGAILVSAVQVQRQWRLTRMGRNLPAGSSPALVGLLRPRVALPVDFEQRFSPAERELILAHEQVHQARLDNLWNLLACALTALHWWNPVAWWGSRRLRADQELACDAAVLATRPDALADYTRALLAAHDHTPHGAPLASRWGSTHPLVERIAMLNQPNPMNRRRVGLVTLLLASAAGLAYAAQTPQLMPSPASGDSVRLTLLLIVQEGNTVRRSSKVLVGKVGERMRLAVDMPTRESGFSVDLTPTSLDEEGFGLDIKAEGLPKALSIGNPRIKAWWDQPSLFESIDDKATSRVSMFVIGKRVAMPADATKPKS
ncbi:M56 family metallopeptidase [Roseateles sp. LYH14W]|uniref:M56 family metallopeptidase n=1 Tax=Pelomonas parva TaxID=3299032 RepID=A0ABW7F6P6_9BURK